MKKVLLTGTLGFIGSNFIRKVTKEYPDYRFIGLDKAVKDYNLNNRFEHPNYKFYFGDIADEHLLNNIFTIEKPNIVIGMAAESFVDDSISNIMPFLQSNIIGTQTLINMCLKHNVEKYVHVSTDETLGQAFSKDAKGWKEEEKIAPRNPYACSKAAAELIVLSAHYTHGLQYNITRSCNIFGPRQKKQNLIPHIITSLLYNKEIHIHGNGKNFRQYCYVDDKIDAIMKIVEHGKGNEIYHIGDNNLLTNLEMVEYISSLMKITPKIKFIENRKAHDFGYKVDFSKLKELDWSHQGYFEDDMKTTIMWYTYNA